MVHTLCFMEVVAVYLRLLSQNINVHGDNYI